MLKYLEFMMLCIVLLRSKLRTNGETINENAISGKIVIQDQTVREDKRLKI